jgi:carboxyl-terminal processing protease
LENYQNTSKQINLPLKLAFTLVVGVLLGLGFGKFGTRDAEVRDAGKKYEQVLELIKEHYVDSVNLAEITDEAYDKMFAKLDPHTSYIPAKDLKLVQSQLESDFEGIGVEFNIYNDTLVVVRTIKRGPSEKAGILPGDKIIAVNQDTIAGVGINNRKVFDLLRGKKGSKVSLLIYRKAKNEFLEIEITRDDIPTFSVEVSYMIDERVGFLKVTRFAENTHNEFKKALIDLKRQGLDRLILDLRNNGGGYMGEAEKMADELLPKKTLIVYTKSKDPHYDHKSYAIKDGLFEEGELIVLINENSASASEILAGAIQDNDRGLILGRRSYGKGLVQRGFQLLDSSEVRITISRYYTPSSRCVQKPYEASIEDYASDYKKRENSGELFTEHIALRNKASSALGL